MKLLVTGGCGFIGSNFIRYWLAKYPQDIVINLDKLTYAGHIESTADFAQNKNYAFVKGDIKRPEIVDKIMPHVDWVVHFAAESHVDRSIKGAREFIETNVIGTQVLLDSAVRHNIRRFHHVSTDEVFGALELKSRKKFNEETPYAPRNPYAASKAASDHMVRAYHYTHGLDTTITNCSNNFGPYQDPEKFIPRAITNVIDGNLIQIYGEGENVRDWLFVEDHCSAINLVLHNGVPGETYVVGGQTKDVTNKEVAEKILKHFDLEEPENMLEFVEDRKGHDFRYAVDWGRIKKELGWKPKYSFDEALEMTVNWYKENEDWWKPLKKKSERLYSNVI